MTITNPASPKHEAQMRLLGEFCGLDDIEYIDHGSYEEYIASKDGRKIHLLACGNRFDGGFLSVVDKPLRRGKEEPSEKEDAAL